MSFEACASLSPVKRDLGQPAAPGGRSVSGDGRDAAGSGSLGSGPVQEAARLGVSLGTAAVLGMRAVRSDVPPSTAYLMTEGRCIYNCPFCAQARESRAPAGLLSRVTWPSWPAETVLQRLRRHFRPPAGRASAGAKSPAMRRICLQVVHSPGWEEEVDRFLEGLRAEEDPAAPGGAGRCAPAGLRPFVAPVCLSLRPRNLEQVGQYLAQGVDKVSIAIDVVNPAQYARLKGGSQQAVLDLLLAASRAYPGRMATHVIVGLGETEEEAIRLLEQLHAHGITVGLFAFTPVRGTRLSHLPPPPLGQYRRVQVANFLLAQGQRPAFQFSPAGRLQSLGEPQERWRRLLADGRAFQTSGCPDCNRPYYNEHPGRRPFNYPRPLSSQEIARALADTELPGLCGGGDL